MIRISLQSSVPLHDQLVLELRRLVAEGTLKRGSALPPVRQLAADLGIHMNTVARAYRDLVDAGLFASARGRGTVVIAEGGARPSDAELQRLSAALSAALAEFKLAGLGADDARRTVDREIRKLWPS